MLRRAFSKSQIINKKLLRHSSSLSNFWFKESMNIDWEKDFSSVGNFSFENSSTTFFKGGRLNAFENCVQRHIKDGYGEQQAIIWQGNNIEDVRNITYNELSIEVRKIAKVLYDNNIKEGDNVIIYMQQVPEAVYSMLACTMIGATHSVVFGAFSSNALKDRIEDCKPKLIITQDFGVRGEKKNIPMKENVSNAISICNHKPQNVLVFNRTKNESSELYNEIPWNDVITKTPLEEINYVDSEHPLFILYTSGSTGKPKGIVHSTGGYLVGANYSFRNVFNYQKGDLFWCTADIGWITGHTYQVYGTLLNRAKILMYEGVPNYPDYGRFWSIIEKFGVNIFYTAPTALRSLMKEGNEWVDKYNLESLKLLGSVGEPIKAPEWHWLKEKIGNNKCDIVDTYWQTETGNIIMYPRSGTNKPGSIGKPLEGLEVALLDQETGKEIEENDSVGSLVIKQKWPSMMRTVFNDNDRFKHTYLDPYPEYYYTGDSAFRDIEGDYYIVGREDDVINVSGHRIGTAELEGEVQHYEGIIEAAVVGKEDSIKGESICVFAISHKNVTLKEINKFIKEKMGSIYSIDSFYIVPELPKTRSGKIMRRILKKIANGEEKDFGELSTLSDPSIVSKIVNIVKY